MEPVIVLLAIIGLIGIAIINVSGRDSEWERRRELDLTDADPEDDEGD